MIHTNNIKASYRVGSDTNYLFGFVELLRINDLKFVLQLFLQLREFLLCYLLDRPSDTKALFFVWFGDHVEVNVRDNLTLAVRIAGLLRRVEPSPDERSYRCSVNQ